MYGDDIYELGSSENRDEEATQNREETVEEAVTEAAETVTETAPDEAAPAISEEPAPQAAPQSAYFDYTAADTDEMTRQAKLATKANRKARRQAEKLAKKQRKAQKKAQKKGSFVKKLAAAACLGLLFGGCAAAGMYGVQKGIAYFDKDAATPVTSEKPAELPENVVKVPETVIQLPDGVTLPDNITQYVTYVQNDITEMVDQVMPAMVSIISNYTTTSYNFWGQYYNRESEASGSGIIVGKTDTQLLIATNNHVVKESHKLEVTFIDGNTAEAVIKGVDPEMDLAVIAVDLNNLEKKTKEAITVAQLGDSDHLKLGEPVVAIGNALGYGQSVTTGIISALNREIEDEDGNINSLIQTDAAINPGNSGGALLNIKGEVIGINSSKMGGSTIEGMGYAIPISSASPILSELMTREVREKVAEDEVGYLGIGMQAINDEAYQSLGLPKGIYITEVMEDSAAEKAGIMKRDIITKFDGQKVTSPSELKERIECYRAGETCTVTISRAVDGEYESFDLEVTLGARPKE